MIVIHAFSIVFGMGILQRFMANVFACDGQGTGRQAILYVN